MSETPKHMKSAAIRAAWKTVLADVQDGEEVVVELYNRPVARIIPYVEEPMPSITVKVLRELAEADAQRESGDAHRLVLAIDANGEFAILARGEAGERGYRIVTDAGAVESFVGDDDEYTADLYQSFADELNTETSR
jgi:antitoxin (DNA-binding transcriptional repressor) of toxin-antitoxin stability system